MNFSPQNLLETMNHTYLDDKAKFVIIIEKNGGHLVIVGEIYSNYLKTPINEFVDPKSHRTDKLH